MVQHGSAAAELGYVYCKSNQHPTTVVCIPVRDAIGKTDNANIRLFRVFFIFPLSFFSNSRLSELTLALGSTGSADIRAGFSVINSVLLL